MTAPVVQSNYEQLNQIAQHLAAHSEATQGLHQALRQRAEALHNGGWAGHAATAFQTEMTQAVSPALARLTEALKHGSTSVAQIVTTLRQAEEEAARLFQGGEGAVQPTSGVGASTTVGAGSSVGNGAGGGTPTATPMGFMAGETVGSVKPSGQTGGGGGGATPAPATAETATTASVAPIKAPSASRYSKDTIAGLSEIAGTVNKNAPQVQENMRLILAECEKHNLTPQQTAYVLATAHHESRFGHWMEELSSGRQYEGRRDLGNTVPGDGVKFKGRGFVQLTGRRNYTKYSKILGEDIVSNPSRVEDPRVAARVMVHGMVNGTFTGRKLSRYNTKGGGFDYINARRIVNGTDQAQRIAGYARRYEAILKPRR